MALLITLFLVLVNIFNNVTTNSPKAETLTAIEIWMLACILFVFGKQKYNLSIKNFIKILWISYIYCQSVERDHFIFHYEPSRSNVPLMTYSTFRHLTCHQRMSSREHSYIHTFIYSYIHATLYLGSLIVYAVILNQKLINKSRKKEARSFKPLHKKRKKKDSEKESVKLTTDIDKPFTMVIDNYCQIMKLKSNTVLTLQKICAVVPH